MNRALFSLTLAEQILNFKNCGFVLIRRCPKSSQHSFNISSLNEEVMKHFDRRQCSFKYFIWRLMNSVSTSNLRHSLPLILTKNLQNVLDSTIGHLRPFLDSQLPKSSPCVELSAIISLPGSKQQETHSDISFSSHNLIVTGMVALCPITLQNGPTHIYSGSHTQSFHQHCSTAKEVNHYSSDGSLEQYESTHNLIETNEDIKNTHIAQSSPALYAELDIGDILLFNTQVFHYGGANCSDSPRNLLCFSFQKPEDIIENSIDNRKDNSHRIIDGFTYHCDDSVSGKFILDNFLENEEI
eukprot:gene12056-25267_t